jgi:hypothetical protein
MKIAIFGASGATGLLLIERCLAAGYELQLCCGRRRSFAITTVCVSLRGGVYTMSARLSVGRLFASGDCAEKGIGVRRVRQGESVA